MRVLDNPSPRSVAKELQRRRAMIDGVYHAVKQMRAIIDSALNSANGRRLSDEEALAEIAFDAEGYSSTRDIAATRDAEIAEAEAEPDPDNWALFDDSVTTIAEQRRLTVWFYGVAAELWDIYTTTWNKYQDYIEGEDLYELAWSVVDKEFEPAFRKWSTKELLAYDLALRIMELVAAEKKKARLPADTWSAVEERLTEILTED